MQARGDDEVLSPEALEFLHVLHDRFEARRRRLLAARRQHQAATANGTHLRFRPDTLHVREGPWQISALPEVLQDRRVEITGPTDRKMMINALNSGASVYMADFEDSHSPTWEATLEGQRNVRDAVRGHLSFEDASGKAYTVAEDPALLVVRVRGLHMDEVHVRFDGEPVSAGLFDFAMAFFHNARRQVADGTGPFYYIPKLEHAEEAAWWNDVFTAAEEAIGLETGTVKATVLIETLPAAFEMEEILHALRHHAAGLNAGRWDYIFSCIKTLRGDPRHVLPDRDQISMTAPFMRAYTEMLVRTCHRRGALAIGGMSAFIPQKDPIRNDAAMHAIQDDKVREARDGFDGTWVAHPALVEVARKAFDDVLGTRPNQVEEMRDDVHVGSRRLLEMDIHGARRTEAGLRTNVRVGIQYLDAWLAGRGAVAIDGLMEDMATAEISRAQVWQWLHHHAMVAGRPLDAERVTRLIDELTSKLVEQSDEPGRTSKAARLFAREVLADELSDFLTIQAYRELVAREGSM